MDPLSLTFPAVAPAPVPNRPEVTTLQQRFSALNVAAQTNPYVFSSPLGPLTYRRRAIWLPRFVFFGPHASDDSWRLAFYGSFAHRDLGPTRALLYFLELLGDNAEEGHGLNLTFFPLVDAAGLALHEERTLAAESWLADAMPELTLLRNDARIRSYHGFVRIETAASHEDALVLSLRSPASTDAPSPDVEIISSAELAPLDVRFEREPYADGETFGPLELAEDLGVQPFELTLRVPSHWSAPEYDNAVAHALMRFVHHYRAFHAFGGDL